MSFFNFVKISFSEIIFGSKTGSFNGVSFNVVSFKDVSFNDVSFNDVSRLEVDLCLSFFNSIKISSLGIIFGSEIFSLSKLFSKGLKTIFSGIGIKTSSNFLVDIPTTPFPLINSKKSKFELEIILYSISILLISNVNGETVLIVWIGGFVKFTISLHLLITY